MLLRSLQQLPGENHGIPIISPSAVAGPADMTVLERQIARLHWQQQQQTQPQSQQQPSYFAAETIATDTPLVPTPYTLPRAPHILSPIAVGHHTTNFCGDQGMISHDLSSGPAGVWPELTHYPYFCDSGPGDGALGGGGGAISRTFSCPPLVGNVESRGRPSPQGSQLDHASATEDTAAAAPALAALSTDSARHQSSRKRKSAESASTYKVEEDDRLKKMMIKAENTETLVEPKVESPSSTVITSNNCKDHNNDNNNNNREVCGSASKEKKKTPEPPPKTDYIHVRARRGQATDSHSLAERVRREKISERMKLLQDLVPGCNKIAGKAGMLDEIINYVQSLQRQVEFLSMKLAAVTPALDFNLDALITKGMSSLAGGCGIPAQMGLLSEVFGLPFLQFNPLQQQAMPAECCSLPLSLVSSCSPAEEALRGVAAAQVSAPPASCSFPDSCNVLVHPPPPSTPSGWEGELQGFYAATMEEFEHRRPAPPGPVDAPSSTFQALISPR